MLMSQFHYIYIKYSIVFIEAIQSCRHPTKDINLNILVFCLTLLAFNVDYCLISIFYFTTGFGCVIYTKSH